MASVDGWDSLWSRRKCWRYVQVADGRSPLWVKLRKLLLGRAKQRQRKSIAQVKPRKRRALLYHDGPARAFLVPWYLQCLHELMKIEGLDDIQRTERCLGDGSWRRHNRPTAYDGQDR